MAAPKAISIGRRGPELRDMWLHWSPPQQGGGVWSHGACGSARAHLNKEARSGDAGHIAGVPSLLSTDSGPRAHLGRGNEPTGVSNISIFVACCN
jgi:hypothetical protein